MKYCLVFAALITISAHVVMAVDSPEFETTQWAPSGSIASAGYDGAKEVYSFSGSGWGVYWCLDQCGFAYIKDQETSGDFTFTARLKSRPENSGGHIGIMVKARLETHAPVASLRWDYYHAQKSGTGLGWFNRTTPSDSIDPTCTSCLKGCNDTKEFGCFGHAYEGIVPDYTGNDPIWLRVIRKKVGNASRYYFMAKRDNEQEFKVVRAQTASTSPCAGDQIASYLLPFLRVPEEAPDGKVYVGLYASKSNGANDVEFDNISFTPTAEVPSMGCLDDDIAKIPVE